MSKRPKVDSTPAMQEFAALCEEVGGPSLADAALKRAGLVGLATLLYRSRRGCVTAAKALATIAVPLPDQSVTVRAANMSREEALAALQELYRQRGLPAAEIAVRLAEADTAGDTAAEADE